MNGTTTQIQTRFSLTYPQYFVSRLRPITICGGLMVDSLRPCRLRSQSYFALFFVRLVFSK